MLGIKIVGYLPILLFILPVDEIEFFFVKWQDTTNYLYIKRVMICLLIFQFTKNFNREFKYTVGESLKKEILELITLI